jgi:hypothetical protein
MEESDMRFPLVAIVAAGSVVASAAAHADLVLNEVLYDPDGADEGFEFVELWNPDASPRSLEGVAVESGDGSRPDAWSVAYRGTAQDTVPPATAFLISSDFLGVPLQNGPDAVRLTRSGVVLDLLGYGPLSAPELFEGAPAPDAPSGWSLARRRDGVDTSRNADDWEVASPTPGRPNRPEIRLECSRASLAVSPQVAWPGETVVASVRARNTGWAPVPAARWALEVDVAAGADSPGGAAWFPAAEATGPAVAAGDSVLVLGAFPAPGAGVFRVRLRLADRSSGDAAIADTAVVLARSVAGPVVVSEFAFHDAGAGEWVELWFRETVEDIGGLSVSDAAGKPRPIDRGAIPRRIGAETYVVVAEDPASVRARFALPDTSVFGVAGGWPALNDDAGGGAVADVVRVLDKDGAPCDAVPYGDDASAGGGSLERLSPDLPSAAPGTWVETLDRSGGTPGRANSLRAPGGGTAPRGPLLVAAARVLRREPGGAPVPLVLRVTAEARGRRLTVRVHDLLGRVERTLVSGQRFTAEGAFVWDGRDDRGEPVPAGLHVVRAETLAEDGAPSRATSLPVAVAPERAR